jgi:hypothetical protein
VYASYTRTSAHTSCSATREGTPVIRTPVIHVKKCVCKKNTCVCVCVCVCVYACVDGVCYAEARLRVGLGLGARDGY